MSSNNLSVLVEAKKEYLFQLSSVMCPVMTETFQEIYSEAKKMSKGKKVLLQYQRLLKEIANWNNHMVKSRSDDICNSCSWFNDLLAAVFVSYVKIFSSVRLNNENKKISIKLPTNDVFIHGCYIAAAKDIYKDPYVFHDEMTDYEREEKITTRLVQCIEATIKEMVPVQDILKAYITQNNTRNLDVTMEEEFEDTEDPDIDEEPYLPGAEPDPETVEPDVTTEPQVTKEPEEPEEPEFKEIDMSGKDDVLFPDAPDN